MRTTHGIIMLTLVGLMVLSVGCEGGRARYDGVRAYEQGQYGAARPQLARAIEISDTDWKAHYHLGLIDLAEGDPVRAQSHFELALAVRDGGPPHQPETPAIIDALAESMYAQGDYPKMVGLCDEMSARYGTPYDHIRKARLLAKMGDHDSALVAYIKAVKIAKPTDVEPYVALADFYESVGKKTDALAMLRRAHGIAPEDEAIADRLRGYGVVPGPAATLPPVE